MAVMGGSHPLDEGFRAAAGERFRKFVADKGDQFLAHLAAQIPSPSGIRGADEDADLERAEEAFEAIQALDGSSDIRTLVDLLR